VIQQNRRFRTGWHSKIGLSVENQSEVCAIAHENRPTDIFAHIGWRSKIGTTIDNLSKVCAIANENGLKHTFLHIRDDARKLATLLKISLERVL
jgi:hypothetical protein